MPTTYYLFFLLVASIVFIIWLTAYKKVNAFFALLIAALGVGLLSGLPAENIVNILKAGFGHTMEKIGLLILFGTTLGVILERTGATISMANAILKIVREKNAPAAIALTGFIIGLPIFCDSGFIILSGLNHSLVKKTKFSMPVMAAALATSLYAVHCLVPPHPGITAAVGTAGGDLGSVMLWGIVLAVPAALVGYGWSVWRGRKVAHEYIEQEPNDAVSVTTLPPAGRSFLPVVLPIALIAAKSVLQLTTTPQHIAQSIPLRIVSFFGDPVIALAAGILISLILIRKTHKKELSHWLTGGVEKAGIILAIIAAGGMFGEMLQATGMGKNLGDLLSGWSLGIFFPFLITAVLKTAQGSSTVAVITAASLVTPLLSHLGLDSSMGVTLAILSMGAGSMVVSHANDAYFWVISRFSNLETAATLKAYSVATLFMGVTVQLLIWLLATVFLEPWQHPHTLALCAPAGAEVVTIAGKPTAYYELLINNPSKDTLRIQQLTISGDDEPANTLLQQEELMKRINSKSDLLIPGKLVRIYLEPVLPNDDVKALVHRFTLAGIHPSSSDTPFVQTYSVQVGLQKAISIGPPLETGNWAAVYDPYWTRGHRRVEYETNGGGFIPGRYAIDFIRLDSMGRCTRAKEDDIQHWYGYGANVLAVADGSIASALDTFSESSTLSAHPAYPAEKATGNYISIDLGHGHYAFYEHLKPGSVKVKPGQKVKKGEVIAALGFTGQTTGPHLHFHIADRNSALGADGLPFAFEKFTLIGVYNDFSQFGKAPWTPINNQPLANERPAPNTVIRFQ